MIKLAPFESCTGCTACMNSCSHNAIVMAEDAEGFIFPHIMVTNVWNVDFV